MKITFLLDKYYDTLFITNGQINLKRGHIAAAHGYFSRIRQLAPVCTCPAYTTHRSFGSTDSARLLDRFSRFCRAYARDQDQQTDRQRQLDHTICAAISHILYHALRCSLTRINCREKTRATSMILVILDTLHYKADVYTAQC